MTTNPIKPSGKGGDPFEKAGCEGDKLEALEWAGEALSKGLMKQYEDWMNEARRRGEQGPARLVRYRNGGKVVVPLRMLNPSDIPLSKSEIAKLSPDLVAMGLKCGAMHYNAQGELADRMAFG